MKILIDGLTIHYETYGDNTKQPLVFIGGLPMKFFSIEANRKVDFNAFKNIFAEYFYVIIVDNPGFGESDPPPRVWSFADYAKFYNTFIKEMGISNPIIMGKSWGGGIALTYAESYSNEIKALILVNAATNRDAKRFIIKIGTTVMKFFVKILTSRIIPVSIKKYFTTGLLNVPREKIDKSTFNKYLPMRDTILNFQLEVDYQKLKMSLILVWGKDDFWTPAENAYTIHKDVENSKLLIFKGGHLMMEQNPQEVIEKIIKNL